MDSIDLDQAERVFAESTDLTIGLEEEFALLNPETLDLAPRMDDVFAAAAEQDPELREHLVGELISAEIEALSGPGRDLADALRLQREWRRRLFALAAGRGVSLASIGAHPWSDYREQTIIDTDHYRRVADGLRYVARRNNTFSLHVHVGVRGLDRAVRACDRLRPILPLLLAVSANSTCVDGCDSGLHSVRSQLFTRSFPRCGVPDHFGGWPAYREYIELLARTRSIVEFTQVWWSVRPHFRYGTIEVRICDAQSTAAESEGLAALIVACVAQALRDVDEQVPFTPPPPRLVEENLWRAIRHGQDGEMIDLETGSVYPGAEIVERLLAWAAPACAELGLSVALPELNGAQRQRRMIDAGLPIEEVFATSVRETQESFALVADRAAS